MRKKLPLPSDLQVVGGSSRPDKEDKNAIWVDFGEVVSVQVVANHGSQQYEIYYEDLTEDESKEVTTEIRNALARLTDGKELIVRPGPLKRLLHSVV